MERGAEAQHVDGCPYLVPVMADSLWLFPTNAYCRRPSGRVRVPAPATMTCICETLAHLACPGYVESTRNAEQSPTTS